MLHLSQCIVAVQDRGRGLGIGRKVELFNLVACFRTNPQHPAPTPTKYHISRSTMKRGTLSRAWRYWDGGKILKDSIASPA